MATGPRQTIGLLTPGSDASVRSLHARFVSDPGNTDLSALRPVVARSWARSLACRVDPGLRVFEETRAPRLDDQFIRDAAAVLSELERTAADTAASICLADHDGTIGVFLGDSEARRRADSSLPISGGAMAEDLVGTNGEGTVVEEGHAVQIWGAEHFCEGMQDFYCTSVPVLDPLRRTLRAILSIALPADIATSVDPRSVALIARGAAAELGQVLASRLAVREQTLLSSYLTEVRKRGADSVVVMDDRTTIASKGALQMLGEGDYGVLAGYAREAQTTSRALEREVALGSRSVMHVSATPIESGGETAGSILRLRLAPTREGRSPASRVARRADQFDVIVGESVGMRRALQVARTAVRRGLPTYVIGEPGTGKSALAGAMARELAPQVMTWDVAIVDVGPAALAEMGRTLDSGGAAVIRHADCLSRESRAALVRFLADRENPLVILTMSKLTDDDTALTTALGGIEIELPPLRNRREDIPQLVAHFLAGTAHGVLRVSSALQRAMTKADWLGNVSELRDFVNTAAARCDGVELGMHQLSESHRRALSPNVLSRLEDAELRQIREALAEAQGNRVRAAELLQIGRSTLYRKIELYERRGYDVGQ